MKRNKIILATLVLILITMSSYTLSKITDYQTYVISVNDAKYDNMQPPSGRAIAEAAEDDSSVVATEPESQPEEAPTAKVQLSPQLTFESDSPTSKQEELKLQEEGIYAVQLYGDALGEENSIYLAGYLTYTAVKKLSYHLGTEELTIEAEELPESESNEDLPKVSQLFQAEITDPIMQVESSEPSLNQKFITEIPEDSKLHELLSPKEERTTSKINVTYLGPISEVEQIEELNQVN